MRDPETGKRLAVDKARDAQGWEKWASLDLPIVTQWDDGNHIGLEPGQLPTSSSSTPSLVAAMLGDLDARPGNRVLDVGTGTGWTTALLAARVGEENVTSVEIDAGLSEQAAANLQTAGYAPNLVVGDGAAIVDGGPFDRIHATYAVRHIPYTWIKQSRPGGIIVVPWGTHFSPTDAVARLTVNSDGTAIGQFTRLVDFMLDRSGRYGWPDHNDYLPGDTWPEDTRESETTLHPHRLLESPQTVAQVVVGMMVPHAQYIANDEYTAFYGLTDKSWAIVYSGDDGPEYEVYQGGPRNLWDEVEAAYGRWSSWGEPDITRYGITVTPHGCQIWLDDPGNEIQPTARPDSPP